MSLDEINKRINRSIGQRVRKSEREVARRYARSLNELRLLLANIYEQYETNGVVTFEEMAKFQRLQTLFQEIDFLLDRNFRDIYPIIYDIIGYSYAESYDLNAWAIEQEAQVAMIAASAQQIQAAVMAPIDKLTLPQSLEAQRNTIIAKIKQEITLGLVQGDTYKSMAERIKPALGGDAAKAVRVIRTETHRVQEEGKHDSAAYAEDQGVIMVKTWRTAKDSRVRRRPRDKTDHKMLEGVTLPVKQKFKGVKGSGLKPGSMGNASEDINCRCFLQYSIARVENKPYNDRETSTFDKWRQENAGN